MSTNIIMFNQPQIHQSAVTFETVNIMDTGPLPRFYSTRQEQTQAKRLKACGAVTMIDCHRPRDGVMHVCAKKATRRVSVCLVDVVVAVASMHHPWIAKA